MNVAPLDPVIAPVPEIPIMNEPLPDLLRRAAVLQREGRKLVGCLLVRSRGSTPQSPGALMLVDDIANTHGTIGGGCVEAEIRRRAHALLAENATGLMSFKLDHDYGWDDGLICGGTIDLAVAPLPDPDSLDEIVDHLQHRQTTSLSMKVQTEEGAECYTLELPPRERLYIAGAGHIGQAVARLAVPLEFEVTLFDDRADMLKKYAPEGTIGVAGDIAERLTEAPLDSQTFVLIVTRGHRHDEQALHAVVGRGAGYVGMIGSRRKVKLIFDDLKEKGISEEDLAAVHAPVGLDIGAETVEEIALSIAAQLVQQKRQQNGRSVSGPYPTDAIVTQS